MQEAWEGFVPGRWVEEIDVRDFIKKNYTPYYGGGEFLKGPSEKTRRLWERCKALLAEEIKKGGVLDIDTNTVSTITSHGPGYIKREDEVIVGLQTDEPLKRAVNPFGGIRMVEQACSAYGYKLSDSIKEIFTKYRTTHNDGVYRAYTEEMRMARKLGIITGLPDSYGRGRIIGDYRRVALYGVDRLIEVKKKDLKNLIGPMTPELVQLREEVAYQIEALMDLKRMAESYGVDISLPAKNAREAVQWVYFAYLGAIKEQNGAAMSLGRVSTFLDIYIERDLKKSIITEEEAQELIDQFVIKLRMARQLRTQEYNELFAGDPMWITEALGGVGLDGRPLVTKTTFRFLNTLLNLGPAPEPNLTVLWSKDLPDNFKRFCAEVSIKTSSIQYENDDLMRPIFGDDYGIACCVSAMKLGKQMQFFGARVNLAKALLLAINGGRDEITGVEIGPRLEPLPEGPLNFDGVWERYIKVLEWLANLYIDTMNLIHYMHDKYDYEKLQMALHDTDVERLMAFGIAGFSVTVDSLSAIKYAKVTPIRDDRGICVDFKVEGDYPKYGNDDERVDSIAVSLVKTFYGFLSRKPLYRGAKPTMSILTITSNVVYGKKTGATPDGRKAGEPFAPGANPMHGRDENGPLAAFNSVCKIPYEYCRDGISYTFSIVPKALGRTEEARIKNLVSLLDGYFAKGGHHINVNVMDKELLIDAMKNPHKYPQLTIRVSGYAVHFVKLSREQQLEVISRTFFESMR
ncbi:formate C-acetyltransferase [Caldanaerovirga acetigignens]|uniref:Formate acetyltransferase n=1 Tax=Caldanaerovirga acetigignens TaxID=447595 RepID=A0A1M7KYT4_9FIRM|nr:formate C-acetyltransferase [Caldanaerovirga acetigignens]SHM70743.1 formate C-acetyltransferase [Caldanaerovirga acetigignens]